MENNEKINQLLEKLDALSMRQDSFSKEITDLRNEILVLTSSSVQEPNKEFIGNKIEVHEEDIVPEIRKDYVPFIPPIPQSTPIADTLAKPLTQNGAPLKMKPVTEKYIGENLTNKIGIGILIIGVAIGAKYSIDHDLISPLTRIILGYLVGIGLIGFGARLKKNYENFSAVLGSGAIAILYFITYAAYSFYGLFSLIIAFALMVIFTAVTVLTAINYNKQVIALIGLVGAYAVPFLLNAGSNDVKTLFSYIAIINVGILLIAIRKYWKALYYSSFVLTWLIFFFWFTQSYQPIEHFTVGSTFLTIFFMTFYLIFLAYKVVNKEKFEITDVILLLANSFIFYGVGYFMLNTYGNLEHYLGLFTLCNAVIHFMISAFIYQQKLADRNLFFLVIGLAVVFVTIAIPVQLDGNWVTLLWVGEATLLFRIGRSMKVSLYEKLSYPMMLVAFVSIIHDWVTYYTGYIPEIPGSRLNPIANIFFLTSILFAGCFALMAYWDHQKQSDDGQVSPKSLNTLASFTISFILLTVLYFSFGMEILNYFNQLYVDSEKAITDESGYMEHLWNDDLVAFKVSWMINYSLLFFSILSLLKNRIFKNQNSTTLLVILDVMVLLVFLSLGLFLLSELRDSYMNQTLSEHYPRGSFNVLIRYISYSLVALLLYSIHKVIFQNEQSPVTPASRTTFDIILYVTILWVASSEFITWMNLLRISYSYKIGLSILWGVYALLLIGLGIWKEKKHLRIGAIILFTVTLIKLFFYDISLLGTIAKTVVFVSLGILLLIISFLYNKYKDVIT